MMIESRFLEKKKVDVLLKKNILCNLIFSHKMTCYWKCKRCMVSLVVIFFCPCVSVCALLVGFWVSLIYGVGFAYLCTLNFFGLPCIFGNIFIIICITIEEINRHRAKKFVSPLQWYSLENSYVYKI